MSADQPQVRTLRNTESRYGSITKIFHWLTALLILTAFPVGYIANEIAHYIQSPEFDGSQTILHWAAWLFSLHKTIGVFVFFTAVLRIFWAVTQRKPGLLHPERTLEAWAAETAHWLLYTLMLLVPLCGWIHHAATTGFAPIWWGFGQDLPFVPKSTTVASFFGTLHWYAMALLGATILAHIGGALKHHFVDYDSTLARMLPGRRALPVPPKQKHSALPFFTATAILIATLGGASYIHLKGSGHSHSNDHAHQEATQNEVDVAEVPQTSHPTPSKPEAGDAAGNWHVDEGTLAISVVQMGSNVSGNFSDWTATINFDETVETGKAGDVTVTIAISSLNLGGVTQQAMGADYFNAETFPTAIFDADIVVLNGDYAAQGILTIRDQSMPLTLPFDLNITENTAQISGSAIINRMDYHVGLGTKDTGTLGFEVPITINLTARRLP